MAAGDITYGSEYVFNSGAYSFYTSVSVIDSNHAIIVFKDYSNSGYGAVQLATISNGNEISYGTKYIFNSKTTDNITSVKIDSTHFVISYKDTTNGNYGTSIIFCSV